MCCSITHNEIAKERMNKRTKATIILADLQDMKIGVTEAVDQICALADVGKQRELLTGYHNWLLQNTSETEGWASIDKYLNSL